MIYIYEYGYNQREQYQTWKNQVFALDNNKCVFCDQIASIAHHILPQKTHPELALNPENGLSYCQDCYLKYRHRDVLEIIDSLNLTAYQRVYDIIRQ